MVRAVTLPLMGREQYKTPDEDIAQEFDRVCQLFQLALGKPSDRVLFQSLMGEANERGLNWIQGLEYVIEQRETSTLADLPSKHPPRPVAVGMSNDLRRAG